MQAKIVMSSEMQRNFVANTRRLMAKKRLSQKQFAKLLGVSEGYISQVLSMYSSPGFTVVEKFAATLGVEPHELVAPSPRSPKKISA